MTEQLSAPITLMQDGAWLVDQEGSTYALLMSNDLGVMPQTRPYTLPELRALVAWLEQQEVQALSPKFMEDLGASFDAAEAAGKSELVEALNRLREEVQALRIESRESGRVA